ncbi:MAG TPA: histidinol-phosphate transaminase [Candidatus Limnocylindrales bacterium]|jgi:histidinol-phosphate aminotransferase|nr:histidinol-phosphate transaminase [Candidatus Limnocylindrales bacterium]
MLSARKAVQQMHEYHPPLAGRKGLRLDFNENTEGCSPRVLARIREITAEDLARYPEREPVEAIAAAYLGLPAEQVLLTNGVDEGIHLLCEAYLEPSDEVIVVTPTFSMYEIFAEATGATVVRVQCDEDLRFPVEKVLAKISGATKLIAVASPNNPTGGVASREQLLAIAKNAPGAALLVDEAYYDFYGKTVIADVGTQPNLFVARTFSKAYGLAGLRIGILAGPREQMPMVRRVSSPYSVNAVALLALPVALADSKFVAAYVLQVKAGRAQLENDLSRAGIAWWPSEANFVLMQIGKRHCDFVAAMRQRGILVRDRSSDPGCDGCVRITLGTSEQTERLLVALRDVVPELKLGAGVSA